MSFGFPVGDLIAVVNLCREIVQNCMSVEGAPKSHQNFQSSARNLKIGLEQIVGVILERNKLAKVDAKPGDFREHPNDHATFSALRDITSDFGKTLETIQLRLKQYPVNKNSGIGRRVLYWLEAEDEIRELVSRCQHHIITINFLLEPFRTKILTDIHQSLKDLNIKVLDVVAGVTNIEEGIQELREMLVQAGYQTPQLQPLWSRRPRPIEICALEIAPENVPTPKAKANDEDGLNQRFLNQLRRDRGVGLKDVSLLELTRSVVWWLEMGRKNAQGEPTPGAIDTLQYINLRKAAWIADGLEEHETLRNSEDDKSFWHSYCQKLKKEVHEALKTIINGSLQVPSVGEIHSQDSSDFTVLVEFDAFITDDLALERPDEDLILEISLPGSSQTQPIHLLVFRQGTGLLRCVEVVRKRGRGVIYENTKEYIISRTEWNLRPFYAFSPETDCWNLALYNSKETKTFTFGSSRDLLAFQHAFTEAHVVYVSSGYVPKPSIPPPDFRRIEYQESGFTKSARKFTSGLLQLWFEKPRDRLDASGSTSSTETSVSPTTPISMTYASTHATSTTAATIYQENQSTTVLRLMDINVSRVFAYVMSEKGTRSFITFPLSDNITHRNSSCCNFYHTHAGYGSPKQKVPTQESEICCLRLVIETVVDGKKFTAQILESKNDDLNNFPGMALDGRRLPKGSKTIKLSWFAITFGSTADKLRFITEYHRLELIRKKNTATRVDIITGIQGKEKKRKSLKTEGASESNNTYRQTIQIEHTHSQSVLPKKDIPSLPTRRSSSYSNFTLSDPYGALQMARSSQHPWTL